MQPLRIISYMLMVKKNIMQKNNTDSKYTNIHQKYGAFEIIFWLIASIIYMIHNMYQNFIMNTTYMIQSDKK